MSIDSLYKQASAIVAKALKQIQPIAPDAPLFTFHLFTDSEQERLQTFLASLPYDDPRKLFEYDTFTPEDFHQFGYWLYLQEALESGNMAEATHYRRRLAVSLEQLVEAFLAIPEQELPDFAEAPRVTIEGVCYTLYRTMYRAMRQTIERELARGKLSPSGIDAMYMWTEAYPA